jgi:ABC-type branched-subunit amino acid transport system substrate-binding protein
MKKTIILIFLAAMLASMSGCEFLIQEQEPALMTLPSGKDENGQWVFDDTVYLGRVVPLTGSLSAFGEGSPFIEEQAIGAINDKGGRGGWMEKGAGWELLTADSRSNTIHQLKKRHRAYVTREYQ